MEKIIKKQIIVLCIFASLFLMGGGVADCQDQEPTQNFFNFNSNSFIHPALPNLNAPPSSNYTLNALRFDFGVINQSMDLVGSYTLEMYISQYERHQYMKLWSSLNNGNGQFPQFNTIFDNGWYLLFSQSADSSLNDLKFIKLRNDISANKDLVSVKGNTLMINQNINGNINSNVYQYLPNGKGKSISTGRFSKNLSYEDILILTTGNHIKIYKNLGTGSLSENESYYFDNITAKKAILAQMTDKYRPEIQINRSDKDELIIISDSYIKIFRNTNDNGFDFTTPFLSYNTGFYNISDVAVGDLNGDGYNDLIITSNDYPYTAKAFMNISGTGIDTDRPIWQTSGYPNIVNSSEILISDIDKDGYNDIILTGNEQHIAVFSGVNLSGTADQTLIGITPYSSTAQVKLADINNLGGETLFLATARADVNTGQLYYSIVGVPPYNLNPPPGKPDIFKDVIKDGNIYHPRIWFFNKNERDFSSYKVYKKGPGSNNFNLIASNITENNFIDYSEYIIDETLGPGQGVFNCFYKITSVDQSSQESVPSNTVGYTVGPHGCLICPIDAEDNLVNKEKENNNFNHELKYGLTSFPNPFNPTTKIVYSIPVDGLVNIDIYNVLGQKVKSLINEIKLKGTYLIEFNGNALPSGIYFVRMQSGSYNEVRKINLVK